MTVPAYNITTGPYTGNGLLDTYSYDFPISDDAEILVFQKTADGVETQLTLGVDYSVVVGETNGTVTRLAGNLPDGVKWLFVSNVSQTQLTSFESQGGFFPDVHEDALDKLTIITQQMTKDIDRSMKISEFAGLEGFNTDLTPAAGEGIRFNDTANGLDTFDFDSMIAHLQSQITGDTVLEASAFSPISWHEQVVQVSVTIPENKNAWSFGPVMRIDSAATVTISEGSFWTIAEGRPFEGDFVAELAVYDEGVL